VVLAPILQLQASDKISANRTGAGFFRINSSRKPYSGKFVGALLSIVVLSASPVAMALQLQQETLKTWDDYIRATNERIEVRLRSPLFLWLDEADGRREQVHARNILVSPASSRVPQPVPAGLIHDWVGAAFIPGATMDDVLTVLRDYNHYKDFYGPSVADSKALGSEPGGDQFSMVVVNKELASKIAFDTEYQSCYRRLDENRWYGVARTTRVQEIRNYGRPDEHELEPGEGSGYLWRIYSFSRYEERDGGVYVEIEAIVLSRDIPPAIRWLVSPIVRSVSKNALRNSLHQTAEAVRAAAMHPIPVPMKQGKLVSSCAIN